jgi:hypothetical protein
MFCSIAIDTRPTAYALARKPKPGRRVIPENAVLCQKIFSLKQQFVIHQSRYVRQQTRHMPFSSS